MPLVRARDLRIAIKEMGYEKGVVHTLELLLDEFAGMRLHLRELTDMTSRCVEQIDRFVHIGDGMMRDIEKIKREGKQYDDGIEREVPPSNE